MPFPSFKIGPPVSPLELLIFPAMGAAAWPGYTWITLDEHVFSTLTPALIERVRIQNDADKSMFIELRDGNTCRLMLSRRPESSSNRRKVSWC